MQNFTNFFNKRKYFVFYLIIYQLNGCYMAYIIFYIYYPILLVFNALIFFSCQSPFNYFLLQLSEIHKTIKGFTSRKCQLGKIIEFQIKWKFCLSKSFSFTFSRIIWLERGCFSPIIPFRKTTKSKKYWFFKIFLNKTYLLYLSWSVRTLICFPFFYLIHACHFSFWIRALQRLFCFPHSILNTL